MSQLPSNDQGPPSQDPWRAFGYITAGVIVYGLVGFGLDRWLGTRFLVAVGIIAGAALGVYMTWARYLKPRPPTDAILTPHDRN